MIQKPFEISVKLTVFFDHLLLGIFICDRNEQHTSEQ